MEESGLQADFEDTVNRLAGGMFVVFFGLAFAALFQFAIRLMLVRALPEGDYGVLILGLVVLEFAAIIAGAGLKTGSARFISYSRGEGRLDRIWGAVRASVWISLAGSVTGAALLFFSAGFLSRLLNAPGLSGVLPVLALALPFSVAVTVTTSIFRGFDRVEVKVVFEDMVSSGLTAALVLAVVIWGSSLLRMTWALTASSLITGSILIAYAAIRLPALAGRARPAGMARELLFFSFPLALESALAMVAFWTDTLMLAFYTGEELVGIYNAAVPFANLLPIFLIALIYIYLPVATKLLAESRMQDVKAIYRSATKWAFLLTLPLFLTFFLFARPVILLFAGDRYAGAVSVLAVLSLGFFTHVFLGPNGMTLVVLGKPNLLLLDGAAGLLLNVGFNALMIPRWGMLGAAIASAISLALVNSLKSLQIYYLGRIHPFSASYLKPVILTVLAAVALYWPLDLLLHERHWLVLLVYPVFLAVALVLTLLSRSLEREDLVFASFILKRLRLDPDRTLRFLSRYLKGSHQPEGGPGGSS
jgi:O-antigen/teichoic acid export membrane protein